MLPSSCLITFGFLMNSGKFTPFWSGFCGIDWNHTLIKTKKLCIYPILLNNCWEFLVKFWRFSFLGFGFCRSYILIRKQRNHFTLVLREYFRWFIVEFRWISRWFSGSVVVCNCWSNHLYFTFTLLEYFRGLEVEFRRISYCVSGSVVVSGNACLN